MAFREEDSQILIQLGLTYSQAKIYLTLLKLGQTTGKTLSQSSTIARQETYRVLNELHEKGYVEKIIKNPTEFKTIPLKDCLNALIILKRKNITESEKKAQRLIELFKGDTNPIQNKESSFILVPEKDAYFRKFRNSISKLQTSCDMLLHWECLLYGLTEDENIWKKAVKRGVKIRFIVFQVKDIKDINVIRDFKINPNFEVRYTFSPPPATMAIFDKKEALISVSPVPSPHHTSSLWSNNPGLIAIFQDYFDKIYTNSYKGAKILQDCITEL